VQFETCGNAGRIQTTVLCYMCFCISDTGRESLTWLKTSSTTLWKSESIRSLPPSKDFSAHSGKYFPGVESVLIRLMSTRNAGPFLPSYSVFIFSFPYFFVSVPCAALSWPSRQLLRDIPCRIVPYRNWRMKTPSCL